jgi:hypothetical protein
MLLTVGEQVETVVLSHLQYGSLSGRLGKITPLMRGVYRVELSDGKTFIVRGQEEHWSVTWKGFEGIDRDLCEAARAAYAADPGGNVATRDFPIR